MALGFVIAPWNEVRSGKYPDFQTAQKELEDAAIKRASEIWSGYTMGGLRPGERQYGATSIRPRDVHGGGTATFSKTYNAPGSWVNIWSYTVPEDEIHAISGALITDPTLIFAQMQFTLEDKTLSIVDIEEAYAYNDGFGVLFKTDKGEPLVAAEETRVLLQGFQERNTPNRSQRVVPLGFQLYKNKDLHIRQRETGN